MNRQPIFRTDDALDDLASEWLCERAEGFTPERAQAFAEWRDENPQHAAAVRRVERALALLDELAVVDLPCEEGVAQVSEAEAPVPRGRMLHFPQRWVVAAAAAVAVSAVGWWQLEPRPTSGEPFAAEAVAQRVALRDGSVVELNAASELRVDFTERERRIDLAAGEAHFQVAPDTTRPFVVYAGDVVVRAGGTAFNVRRNGSAVEVLVFEGKVEVTRANARAQLVAGDRTHVGNEKRSPAPQVEKAGAAAIREAMAWQNPMTTFNDVPLRDVVTRFNQRNAIQFVFADGPRRIVLASTTRL